MDTILTAYSDYSPGYSILKIPELVAEAKRLGQKVVGLTDIMSVNGLVELTQECDKVGIHPIIGATLRICTDINWRKTKDGPKKPPDYYIRWYVCHEGGLKQLYNLLSLANSIERFYQEPRLTIEDVYCALGESGYGAIITTGSLLGAVNFDKYKEIADKINMYGRLYYEISPINTPLFDKTNYSIYTENKKLNYHFNIVYTYPTLYLRGQDRAQEIMLAINRNLRVSDGRHYKNAVRDFYPLSSSELRERVELMSDRLEKRFNYKVDKYTTDFVEMLSEYKWKKPPISLPSVVKPDENSYSALVQRCKDGFQNKLINKKVFNYQPSYQELRDRYHPRLNKELAVIKECGFSDYFLLVADLVQWAKDNKVRVGCGRGSVGGSLVAYILNITECDPVRFDLLFERFINKERLDLPDIDMDIMSKRRSEVIEYLQQRYGLARVAGITNYITLQPAGAIRDVGKTLGLEEKEYECSKLVLKKHGLSLSLDECAEGVPEIDRFRRTYSEVWEIAQQLVGKIKVFGRHASGIVVGGCDLAERCVLDARSGEQMINWDKYLAEQQGFVKIDILGLTTLDLIDCALQYIRKRHNNVPDLNEIDLNDVEVLKNFAAGKTIGVFQFESAGMRKLLAELGADGTLVFDDLVAVTALYRPGPLDSGMTDSYVRRKRGHEAVDYVVPQMKAALEKTYGVAVYQEQVMQLARDLAGFSFSEADSLRKAMGKKDSKVMATMEDRWVRGCIQHSKMDGPLAQELFNSISNFASYAFNASHSCAYSLLSYQIMWLKTHYTVEFFAAAFSLLKTDKLAELIKDAKDFGIEIIPPDVQWSTDQFEVLTDTKLLIPFGRIKGIGDVTTRAIVGARKNGKFKSVEDFLLRVPKNKCNKRHVELLQKVGAFATVDPEFNAVGVEDRLRNQQELLENLTLHVVPVDKKINQTHIKETLLPLLRAHSERISCDYNEKFIMPTLGSSPKFMVVLDAPSKRDEGAGGLLRDKNQYITTALTEAGLFMKNAYWTSMIKSARASGKITGRDQERDLPLLEEEIKVVNAPLIVLLGTGVLRYFIPSIKERASDAAGRVVFDSSRNVNFLCGFNPNEVYFDSARQQVLNDVFGLIPTLLT